ncbi:hypothetical protein K6Y31_20710 [Motilimonas cestriensis]|uniref:Uncharacterized protein n=1 Tax=Motilimonas cestriensis TaxID=2742685 RepID=A0ABS8WHU1_9GAMM|nr:hypothetical protein [Motilimonas cestriensis]MCE2597199.1 hypothetical protein [Motilimonas cestriensis]
MVDPRVLLDQMDSELMALWLAYFEIKHEQITADNPPAPNQPRRTKTIEHADVDRQVSECERIMMM